MSKPNKDGWIRHRGGKCPVEDVVVECKMRDGVIKIGDCPDMQWHHFKHYNDVMYYRLHKPAEQPEIEPSNDQEPDPQADSKAAAQAAINPLEWRDRITEIDATVEALQEERASLVQRLEAEGFRLIERAVQSVEDMSDWRNWKAGDQVKVILNNDCPGLWIGRVVTIRSVEPADYDGSMPVSVFYDGDWNFPEADDGSGRCVFQFHSRPSK